MVIGEKFNSGRINYLLTHGGFSNTTQGSEEESTIEDTIETQPESQSEARLETRPENQPTPVYRKTISTQGTRDSGKELANLAKMYTEDSKYSGENDNFDFKLIIFNDLCSRANVPKDEDTMAKAYPIMLCGLALDHYYTNLKDTQTYSFDKICNMTRLYFEGPEYRRGVLGQWNSLTLKTLINKSENAGKSTLDCLQLLIKELRHLQHGLNPDLCLDKFLYNKLINAC